MDLKNKYIKYDDTITEEQINKVLDIAKKQGFETIGKQPDYSGLKEFGCLRFTKNLQIQSVSKNSTFDETLIYVGGIFSSIPNESWCVIVTKDNRDIVKKWLKTQTPNHSENSLNHGSKYGIHNNTCCYNACSGYSANRITFNKTLSTEEFYAKIGHTPEQSKPEFTVGDWYTCTCNKGLYEYKEQGKSSEHLNFSRVINPTDRTFMSHKPHSISKDHKDSYLCYFSPSKKADMSVVNKYLNQGNLDMKDILAECERKFPQGCRIKSAYNDRVNIVKRPLQIRDDKIHDGFAYLYHSGKYATLIAPTPVQESNLNKAKKLYPRGTKFIPVGDDEDKGVLVSNGILHGGEHVYANLISDSHINAWVCYEGKWAKVVDENDISVKNPDINYNTDPIKKISTNLELLKDDVLEIKTKKKIKRKSLNIQLLN